MKPPPETDTEPTTTPSEKSRERSEQIALEATLLAETPPSGSGHSTYAEEREASVGDGYFSSRAAPITRPSEDLGETGRQGQIVAGRYTLVRPLGAGAFGEVWTAEDRVLGHHVALKWLHRFSGPGLTRVRREIALLRLLQVPGVVRLLDEGLEEGRPFLVMERVEGHPFPGRRVLPVEWGQGPRWTWAQIAEPSLALLEVLARVHAAGVVHRDLKPDNVLVGAGGRTTLLDFGISLWQDPGDKLTQTGQVLGTPRYLAPEQLSGQTVDGRADLYAMAVMLYQALTGEMPHEASDVPSMLRARLLSPARPIERLAPDLPPDVAQGIDRMLALRREDRFRSAAEAIAAFRGQHAPIVGRPLLPRLGGEGPVQAVVAAVLDGRSIDIVGAAGTGRSRCLADVADALQGQGRQVARVERARSPLGSLRPVAGTPAEHGAMSLAELSGWIFERIQGMIREGTVFLVDDAEQVDRWSTGVLDRCQSGPGAIARAWHRGAADVGPARLVPATGAGEVVQLTPLTQGALEPLFAGPDRLFHLREDAARALWERTEGLPMRIDAEVTLWLRLGMALWDKEKIVVDRDALNRLHAGLPGALSAKDDGLAPSDDLHGEDLLRWLSLAGRHLPVRDLARVMGRPVWAVEAECDVLVECGLARKLSGGLVEPRGQVDAAWSGARRIEAHRAVAAELGPGQEGRLLHLLAADDPLAAAREAVVLARRYAAERGLGEATAALSEGLRAVREQEGRGGLEEEMCILTEWTKVAFAQGTPGALDRVLYELSRCRSTGPMAHRLSALARSAMAAPGASGFLAIETADELPAFDDPELERRRQRARIVAAAVRVNTALLDDVLADVEAWVDRTGDRTARLCLAEGMGLLRYQQGRFAEAAALNFEAAELDPWLTGKIAATLNGASALLEAFRHKEAEERALAGLGLARYCRQPYWEARAEWLVRSARYRMGLAGEPDIELCEASVLLAVPDLEGLIHLTEAAAAMRARDLSTAVALGERAARIWREMARTWSAALATSLAISCGSPAEPDFVDSLAARVIECKLPGVGLQVLALLARASPVARERYQESNVDLTRGVPEAFWNLRMDVLSVNEALATLAGVEEPVSGT